MIPGGTAKETAGSGSVPIWKDAGGWFRSAKAALRSRVSLEPPPCRSPGSASCSPVPIWRRAEEPPRVGWRPGVGGLQVPPQGQSLEREDRVLPPPPVAERFREARPAGRSQPRPARRSRRSWPGLPALVRVGVSPRFRPWLLFLARRPFSSPSFCRRSGP